VDPNTGTTTRIGNLGTSAVYGLGYAYEQLYGFTSGGRMLAIDATDADASSQRLEGAWWGATTNPVLW